MLADERLGISLSSQEVKLQHLSQLTEYFLAEDLCYLSRECMKLSHSSSAEDFTSFFKSLVLTRKETTFPISMRPSSKSEDTAPDWNLEIGGLTRAKEIIEDMFGVT